MAGLGVSESGYIFYIANMIIFFVLLFSPIIVPIDQFPDWLASAHRALPFYHMAQAIRDGLTTGFVTSVATSYGVIGAWTVAGWAATAWVVGRRGWRLATGLRPQKEAFDSGG